MKKKIYLAGKVKNTSLDNRMGGWRNQLIKDIFDVDIEIGLNAADEIDIKNLVLPINNDWEYVGPYLFGCDHSCSHSGLYAHGILNCTSSDYMFDVDEDNIPIPNRNVFEACISQIYRSDVMLVNFNEKPLESYGTLAEIGVAYARGIPIYSIGSKHHELWFIEEMTTHLSVDRFKELLNVGQIANS